MENFYEFKTKQVVAEKDEPYVNESLEIIVNLFLKFQESMDNFLTTNMTLECTSDSKLLTTIQTKKDIVIIEMNTGAMYYYTVASSYKPTIPPGEVEFHFSIPEPGNEFISSTVMS